MGGLQSQISLKEPRWYRNNRLSISSERLRKNFGRHPTLRKASENGGNAFPTLWKGSEKISEGFPLIGRPLKTVAMPFRIFGKAPKKFRKASHSSEGFRKGWQCISDSSERLRKNFGRHPTLRKGVAFSRFARFGKAPHDADPEFDFP
jgi:hypothetical protein